MLKVDAKFKLDRSYRGPYRVHNVTSTCACIQPINSPDKEKIFVSLQQLSRCDSVGLASAKPWLGHGRTRKRPLIRPRPEATAKEVNNESSSRANDTDSLETHSSVTRRGRIVKKPFRYRINFYSFPEGSASQQGGSCKAPDRNGESYERIGLAAGVNTRW